MLIWNSLPVLSINIKYICNNYEAYLRGNYSNNLSWIFFSPDDSH